MQAELPISSTLTNEEKSKLWAAADALRGHLDAADYKHTVLGLIFLKYISDAFEERRAELVAEQEQGADPDEKDEYTASGTFWVPEEARWSYLAANAKQPGIGDLIDIWSPAWCPTGRIRSGWPLSPPSACRRRSRISPVCLMAGRACGHPLGGAGICRGRSTPP
jgi:HsdM N-terminal domain